MEYTETAEQRIEIVRVRLKQIIHFERYRSDETFLDTVSYNAARTEVK